ncbi:hypothetical protein DIPPA_08998 [Diplonema papillatum]|nr:hypothetical protein DIPPA_08998 [Diplonema papillatum]
MTPEVTAQQLRAELDEIKRLRRQLTDGQGPVSWEAENGDRAASAAASSLGYGMPPGSVERVKGKSSGMCPRHPHVLKEHCGPCADVVACVARILYENGLRRSIDETLRMVDKAERRRTAPRKIVVDVDINDSLPRASRHEPRDKPPSNERWRRPRRSL